LGEIESRSTKDTMAQNIPLHSLEVNSYNTKLFNKAKGTHLRSIILCHCEILNIQQTSQKRKTNIDKLKYAKRNQRVDYSGLAIV